MQPWRGGEAGDRVGWDLKESTLSEVFYSSLHILKEVYSNNMDVIMYTFGLSIRKMTVLTIYVEGHSDLFLHQT